MYLLNICGFYAALSDIQVFFSYYKIQLIE